MAWKLLFQRVRDKKFSAVSRKRRNAAPRPVKARELSLTDQRTETARPSRCARGTGPQKRESSDSSRLSPIAKKWPALTASGPKRSRRRRDGGAPVPYVVASRCTAYGSKSSTPVHAQGLRLGLDPVPRHRDGALDEIAAGIGRVPEDDHVPAREVAVREHAGPRTPVRSVRELVHEHVVAREDRVLHRRARHVEDLEDEALERERERGGHEDGLGRVHEAPLRRHHSTLRTARKASCGSSTRPTFFMRRLPSFCFSRSFFLRVMSPP